MARGNKNDRSDDEYSDEPVKKQRTDNGDVSRRRDDAKLGPKADAKASRKNRSPSASSQEESKGDDNGSSEVFVRGLSYDATEDDLKEFFSECGSIDNVKILTGPQGRSKGIAFVKFAKESGVKSAIRLSGSEHMGRTVQIEKSQPREQRSGSDRGGGRGGDSNTKTVFVGNLSYSVTEDGIRDFFESCGDVASIRIARDHDGKAKGFAHVEFEDTSAAKKAVGKNGSDLDGRSVKVDYASERKSGGGFGGGGRGGGRGGFGGGGRGGYGGGGRGRDRDRF